MKAVDIMTCSEVSKILGINPIVVKFSILNGSMPIGMVARDKHSTKDRTIVIKARLEKWVRGELADKGHKYGIPYARALMSEVASALDASIFSCVSRDKGKRAPIEVIRCDSSRSRVPLVMGTRFEKWLNGEI